jgi:hypothetical protein
LRADEVVELPREGLMKGKRQTTRAKLERERLVRERRTLKLERKQAAAAARDEARTRPVEDTISVEPDA